MVLKQERSEFDLIKRVFCWRRVSLYYIIAIIIVYVQRLTCYVDEVLYLEIDELIHGHEVDTIKSVEDVCRIENYNL